MAAWSQMRKAGRKLKNFKHYINQAQNHKEPNSAQDKRCNDTFTGNFGYSAGRTTEAKMVKGLRAKMWLREMEHLTRRG